MKRTRLLHLKDMFRQLLCHRQFTDGIMYFPNVLKIIASISKCCIPFVCFCSVSRFSTVFILFCQFYYHFSNVLKILLSFSSLFLLCFSFFLSFLFFFFFFFKYHLSSAKFCSHFSSELFFFFFHFFFFAIILLSFPLPSLAGKMLYVLSSFVLLSR